MHIAPHAHTCALSAQQRTRPTCTCALKIPRHDSTMPEFRMPPRQAPFFRCNRAAVGPSPASGGKYPRQPR
ncbi:hypothetical protein DUNSADRAFT_4240 [Dunaliella salina]|uniref:Encoded protein n=1 Tax=Dunaliella salina TaxID=3046 RepID=A0ABQ7FV33_DUNSA|nr:hypothetical protein DUNSADRAFT_4240 [Dunaliella salina]|eukprot:KAF5826193.1 hypothetical protein DUNSADRAFT_4240 [Dunaliella salina]